MSYRYRASELFARDGVTRLIVPNIDFIITNAVTNLASSITLDPPSRATGQRFFRGSTLFRDANPTDKLKEIVSSVVDVLSVGVGVTEIEAINEYTMPMSKGIGSTGEVIHLLGAKNEQIRIKFNTDQYPGRLGILFRNLLQKVLEDADVVYLVDDMFTATPCLVKNFTIKKVGEYRGAIMGSMDLVSLSTGSTHFKDAIGKFSGKLKNTIQSLVNRGRANPALTSAAVGTVGVAGFGVLLTSLYYRG